MYNVCGVSLVRVQGVWFVIDLSGLLKSIVVVVVVVVANFGWS